LANNLKLVNGGEGGQLSPGRQAIKMLLDDRQTLIAEGARLRAAIGCLSAAECAESAYSAELAAIEALEAADVQAWATSGAGDAPGPRIAERAELEGRSSEARAKAAAARTAAGQLRQQLAEAERKAKAIEAEIEIAILPVLSDEAAPIIEELKRVSARHNELIALALGIREPIILLGHQRNSRLPDTGRSHLTWLERYDTQIGDLKPQGPSLDQVAHARLEWFARIAQATGGIVKGLDQ
jgi:hypothetical protein